MAIILHTFDFGVMVLGRPRQQHGGATESESEGEPWSRPSSIPSLG